MNIRTLRQGLSENRDAFIAGTRAVTKDADR